MRRPIATLLLLGTVAAPAAAGLDDYVRAADASFAWKQAGSRSTDAGTVHEIDLTSQTWRGIPWTHTLRIYQTPDTPYPDLMLLFITGGRIGEAPDAEDDQLGFQLAALCGTRVALLPQVPNQPLLGDRFEDDLIGETFVNFLKTGEADWPLLQPMVKSAVRAMDAAQQWAEGGGSPVRRFVVTGASKRGWTTWLTAAVDPRVAAIAPMVIPTLSMKRQTEHQKEVWGFYSEQIEDYTRRGLTESFNTPEGAELWKIVDPYFYLDRITMPKLQINGTNDRYWSLDSMNVFWNDLRGPSYVVYLPNAGHSLDQHREYALRGVASLVRHTAKGQALPALEWTSEAEGPEVRLEVASNPPPRDVTLWVARNDSLDFREAEWTPQERHAGAGCQEKPLRFEATAGDREYVAAFLDLTYEFDGIEYHLSTQIRQNAAVTVP